MEFYYILYYLIGMFCGLTLGIIVVVGFKKQGILEIDTSKEDKDRYLLVVTCPMEELGKKKFLLFQVKKKNA